MDCFYIIKWNHSTFLLVFLVFTVSFSRSLSSVLEKGNGYQFIQGWIWSIHWRVPNQDFFYHLRCLISSSYLIKWDVKPPLYFNCIRKLPSNIGWNFWSLYFNLSPPMVNENTWLQLGITIWPRSSALNSPLPGLERVQLGLDTVQGRASVRIPTPTHPVVLCNNILVLLHVLKLILFDVGAFL